MNRAILLLSVLLMGCASRPASVSETAPGVIGGLAQARSEIEPLFQRMFTAANAHDTDAHLSVYARTPDILFVINTDTIQGWDALHAKQLQWWQDGKSDVIYTVAAGPDYRMPAPGLVLQSYALSSHRVVAGAARDGRINVSALWQRRTEGWRIVLASESTAAR